MIDGRQTLHHVTYKYTWKDFWSSKVSHGNVAWEKNKETCRMLMKIDFYLRRINLYKPWNSLCIPIVFLLSSLDLIYCFERKKNESEDGAGENSGGNRFVN